jgi:hypothetical protein
MYQEQFGMQVVVVAQDIAPQAALTAATAVVAKAEVTYPFQWQA